MPTIGLFTQRPRGAAQSIMDQFTRLTPEGLLDFRGITAPTAGTLTGAPGTGGSPAAGQKPAVPDPRATQADALAGNLANLAKYRQLLNQTSQAVGVGPGMRQSESENIRALLDPPSQYVDINRMAAEAGTGTGVAGSPAAETRGYRMTDEEMLRRRLLGSNLLSQVAARATSILPPLSMLIRPETQQTWKNLANMIKAAPDPEAAFRRALGLAQSGINRGFGAGYGGGAPRIGAPMGPGATYAGDVNWNNLTAARAASVPTWPTLPTNTPGTTPPGQLAPITGEDWLSSLGLGLGQPGVTTAPTPYNPINEVGPGGQLGLDRYPLWPSASWPSSFIGDVNVPEDLYA